MSHQVVIENMYGLSYDKPARHMAQYLQIIAPLLQGKSAEFETRYIQELLTKTGAAIAATDKLGTLLTKIRRDCE